MGITMEQNELREKIVIPSLKITGLWSQSAENLLVATAMIESNLSTLIQDGGPALSWWQIEPKTYQDCLRYLKSFNTKEIKEAILSACFLQIFPADAGALMWNVRLACLMARIKYYMRPEQLPKPKDYEGMYKYYKNFYNSNLGDATEQRCLPIFKDVCDGV